MKTTSNPESCFHKSLATPHDPDLPSDPSWQEALKWLSLVQTLARKFHKRGLGLALDDLIQEGLLGAKRAVELYDPGVGISLGRHVALRVWMSMQIQTQIQANVIYIPGQPYCDAHRLYHGDLDTSKLSPGRLQCAQQADLVRFGSIASNNSDEGHASLQSFPSYTDWEEIGWKMDLENSLGTLSREEKFVIQSHFVASRTWKIIAREMGMHLIQVREIRDRALEKLRNSLHQKELKHAS